MREINDTTMPHVKVSNGSWEFKSPTWFAMFLIGLVMSLLSAWGLFVTDRIQRAVTMDDLRNYVTHSQLLELKGDIIAEIHKLESCITTGPCVDRANRNQQ